MQDSENRAAHLGCLHMVAFLTASALWMVAMGISVGLVLALSGSGATDLMAAASDPVLLGVMSMVQIAGIGALSVFMARLLKSQLSRGGSLTGFLGYRSTHAVWWAAGAIGALTVWTFPSWVAVQLTDLLGWEGSTVEVVSEGLRGPLSETWPLVLAVAVSAPLIEETIFRGYIWSLLEDTVSPRMALVGSTLLFAAYHLDPIHVVSLLPTAAFLGYLRWKSGSVWPATIAHFVNNSLAVVAGQLAADGTDPTEALPWWLALAGLAFTVLVLLAARRVAQAR